MDLVRGVTGSVATEEASTLRIVFQLCVLLMAVLPALAQVAAGATRGWRAVPGPTVEPRRPRETRLSTEAASGQTWPLADLVSWGQPAELRKGPIVVLADGGFLPAAVLGADKAESVGRFGPPWPATSCRSTRWRESSFACRRTPRNWMPCSIASPADRAKPTA